MFRLHLVSTCLLYLRLRRIVVTQGVNECLSDLTELPLVGLIKSYLLELNAGHASYTKTFSK